MGTEPSLLSNKAIRQLSAAGAATRLEELNDGRKLAKMPLHEAGMAWLETRRPFLGPRTIRDYGQHIVTLVKFFGNVRLDKLANPDLIRAYQLERRKTCGPTGINHELTVLQQLLKRIGKWNDIREFYEALPLPRESPGRAMTPDEERRLFETGGLNPNWATAVTAVSWCSRRSR